MENKEQEQENYEINFDLKGIMESIVSICAEDMEGERAGAFNMKFCNKTLIDASKKEIPRMLFSEFWYEGELCILFADTNVGKSILAVMIGDSISKGLPIPGHKLEAKAQPVVLFDFELGEKQFENRYSNNYTDHYKFSDEYYRCDIDADEIPDRFETFEDYINYSIDLAVMKSKAKVLIIDNITYLKAETERSKDALPLMKHLKQLKTRYNLSILCLAHTPKRDNTKPITKNDLAGSKMLINFCDSSFCIGESAQDKAIRYIKQVKQRNCEEIYGANNILLHRVEKPGNFLQFKYTGSGKEWQHLKQKTDDDKQRLLDKILDLRKEDKSFREIANELGIGHSYVAKLVKEYNDKMPFTYPGEE